MSDRPEGHQNDDDGHAQGGHAGKDSWEVGGQRFMKYEAFVAKVRAPYEAELRAAAEARARAQAQAGAGGGSATDTLMDPSSESRLAEQIRERARQEAQAERERAARALAAPSSRPTDELLDHNYDGIQEYDNPTPGWWWMVLWGTVAFSVIYVAIYHFSPITKSLAERHAMAEERNLVLRFAELSTYEMGETKLRRIMGEPAWLDQGASIYVNKCALCHGQQGEGLVGPNLTDDVYKNTTTLFGIAEVIADGAANNAMPAQKNLLNENEIALVSAYVASLRSTNVPNGKEPEGERIAPWPAPLSDEDMASQ